MQQRKAAPAVRDEGRVDGRKAGRSRGADWLPVFGLARSGYNIRLHQAAGQNRRCKTRPQAKLAGNGEIGRFRRQGLAGVERATTPERLRSDNKKYTRAGGSQATNQLLGSAWLWRSGNQTKALCMCGAWAARACIGRMSQIASRRGTNQARYDFPDGGATRPRLP